MLNAEDYRRIKEKIELKMKETFYAYVAESEYRNLFLMPDVAYFDAKCEVFDKLSEMGISESMKRIYRAGRTLVVFTVPFSKEVVDSNLEGDEPSDLWKTAYLESVTLIMKLNSCIKAVLKEWGRVTSSLNTPMDWNMSKAREEWSHRTAGAIAGLGRLTSSGIFIDRNGNFARVSAVVTDCDISGRYEGDWNSLLEKVLSISVAEDEIKGCPCGAITKDGFDRFRCQDFCMKYNELVPSPELCGKCIRRGTSEDVRFGLGDILTDIVTFFI